MFLLYITFSYRPLYHAIKLFVEIRGIGFLTHLMTYIRIMEREDIFYNNIDFPTSTHLWNRVYVYGFKY